MITKVTFKILKYFLIFQDKIFINFQNHTFKKRIKFSNERIKSRHREHSEEKDMKNEIKN